MKAAVSNEPSRQVAEAAASAPKSSSHNRRARRQRAKQTDTYEGPQIGKIEAARNFLIGRLSSAHSAIKGNEPLSKAEFSKLNSICESLPPVVKQLVLAIFKTAYSTGSIKLNTNEAKRFEKMIEGSDTAILLCQALIEHLMEGVYLLSVKQKVPTNFEDAFVFYMNLVATRANRDRARLEREMNARSSGEILKTNAMKKQNELQAKSQALEQVLRSTEHALQCFHSASQSSVQAWGR